jgi:hypothetical protein
MIFCSLRSAGVKAIGKVGLSLDADYFKTVNYDILYETVGSYLSVRNIALTANFIIIIIIIII